MKGRFIVIVLGLVVIIAIVINLSSFNKYQDWGDDFAGYILQAKTISSGAYAKLEADIKRNDFILNYPWGFPAIISPVISLFDSNIILLKQYIYIFFILSLAFTFLLFKKEKELAFITTALLASSPYFWEFKNYLLADFPNLCFVLLALLIAKNTLSGKNILNESFSWFLAGLVIFVSYMIRNQSIVLLPTLLVTQLILHKKSFFQLKRFAVFLIPVLTFLVLLGAANLVTSVKSVTYLNQYAHLDLKKTISENSFYYINVWQELFATTEIINNCVGVFTGFLLTLMIIGLTTSFKENTLLIVFFFLSVSLVLVSPFYQGIRYLIPLVPLLFYFFIKGLRGVIFQTEVSYKFKNGVYFVVVAAFLLLSLKTIFDYTRSEASSKVELEGPYKKTSVEMFAFIRNATLSSDLVGFWKPRAMLLYTERNGVILKSLDDCIRRKIDYFVYQQKAFDQISEDEIKSHSENFQEVFRNSDFVIYKFIEEGA